MKEKNRQLITSSDHSRIGNSINIQASHELT